MRVGSVIAGSTRHLVSFGLQGLLMAAIVAALAFAAATVTGSAPGGANPALAAKGGGSTSPSWISLAQTDGFAAASQITLGSTVTFSAGYPSNTPYRGAPPGAAARRGRLV